MICRARCLLPLLAALAATGCVAHSGDGRGLLTSTSAAPLASSPQGDIQERPVGRNSSIVQYRAPPSALGGVRAAGSEPFVPPVSRDGVYTLDSGDKLRVVVFGQEGITGSYMVDAGGNVSLPLVGSVPARGLTTQALSKAIADRLRHGYMRDPNVTVEVEAYRPFFILGEVTTPGQYPYVPNMTVETAVAIAGGFAPRADKRTAEITRRQAKFEVPFTYAVRPGDTIMVKERWF